MMVQGCYKVGLEWLQAIIANMPATSLQDYMNQEAGPHVDNVLNNVFEDHNDGHHEPQKHVT